MHQLPNENLDATADRFQARSLGFAYVLYLAVARLVFCDSKHRKTIGCCGASQSFWPRATLPLARPC
jgi:hypothetical protein